MIAIDLFAVFLTFDMDKLGKIHWHHWKQRPKINTIAWIESDLLKTNKDIAPHFAKFYRRWYGGGGGGGLCVGGRGNKLAPPHHTFATLRSNIFARLIPYLFE